ncbi:hypothetical protein Celaphus_00001520 [Cervus elaphus hippelaphus]|uniref:Nuclear pore localisation protein Npl4 ubiquitin-like domain-containing protein n=1 Tax=Cervus elaphus hippelaphus TaxID=46360 RepID=A0A212D8F9_CEREH|nr:hypothetical protein Celaphus_00001520 [Cervus elaphus hippelaphus]
MAESIVSRAAGREGAGMRQHICRRGLRRGSAARPPPPGPASRLGFRPSLLTPPVPGWSGRLGGLRVWAVLVSLFLVAGSRRARLEEGLRIAGDFDPSSPPVRLSCLFAFAPIIRVQSPDGVKRITATKRETAATFLKKVPVAWVLTFLHPSLLFPS